MNQILSSTEISWSFENSTTIVLTELLTSSKLMLLNIIRVTVFYYSYCVYSCMDIDMVGKLSAVRLRAQARGGGMGVPVNQAKDISN